MMKSTRDLPFVIFLLLLTLAVAGLWFAGRTGAASGAASQPTLSPEQAQIATLQAALDSGHRDAQARSSLEEKLQMAQRIATQQALALQVTPAVEAQGEASPTPFPTPQFETVFFEGSEGLVRPSLAAVQNGWQGMVEGVPMQVFAGASADDPAQGVIIVIIFSDAPSGRAMSVYPAPTAHGWLRILSEANGMFQLSAKDGSAVQFDVRSAQFIAAP
jgi:hypothetical protein